MSIVGGNFEMKGGSITDTCGEGVGAVLPTARDMSREGYTFAGWYANADFSGSPVAEIGKTDMGNKTFYAKWETAASTYAVTIKTDGHGSAPPISAAMGEKITLTAMPNEGYRFKQWEVASQNATLSDANAASTTFIMPAENVTITAAFEKTSEDGSGGSGGDSGGSGDGSFDVNDAVTHEQLAAIFYRYAQLEGLHTAYADGLDAFANGGEASDWSRTALSRAVQNGILSGKGDIRLDPKGIATRAELAAMFKRFAAQMEQ